VDEQWKIEPLHIAQVTNTHLSLSGTQIVNGDEMLGDPTATMFESWVRLNDRNFCTCANVLSDFSLLQALSRLEKIFKMQLIASI